MDALVLKLVAMSVAAGISAGAVMLLRLLLKRSPRRLICALWIIVAVRLVLPWSIKTDFSAFNVLHDVKALQGVPAAVVSNISPVNETVPYAPENKDTSAWTTETVADEGGAAAKSKTISAVYISGVGAMALYGAISRIKLKRRVGPSVMTGEGVYICDEVNTPFILGVAQPRIYLPSNMGEEQMKYVLAHEKAHIKRRDHWWKPMGFVLLSFHWFNPLIWLAYIMLCKDIELACDEKVISSMAKGEQIAYSRTLLACSAPQRAITACPLAFGETNVKDRIKTVLNYRKPAFWAIIGAVLLCVVVALCLLSDPKTTKIPIERENMISAHCFDVRGGGEVKVYFLNEEELDELAQRIAALSNAEKSGTNADGFISVEFDGTNNGRTVAVNIKSTVIKSDEYAGFTPFYQISIELDDGNALISGYGNDSAAMTDIDINGERFVINDIVFNEYISEFCKKRTGSDGALPMMTLDDVAALSQKGDSLTWADVAGFDHIDTGSGLYIQVFDTTDERFTVMVGGVPNGEIMYARLIYCAKQVESYDGLDWVDIRTEDAREFISKYSRDHGYVPFHSEECIYMFPLSSYYPFDGDSDCEYYIGSDSITILNQVTGTENRFDDVLWGFERFAEEQWKEWFKNNPSYIDGVEPCGIPDISGFATTKYIALGDRHRLLNMDGTLWIMELTGITSQNYMVRSVYRLVPGSRNAVEDDGVHTT